MVIQGPMIATTFCWLPVGDEPLSGRNFGGDACLGQYLAGGVRMVAPAVVDSNML